MEYASNELKTPTTKATRNVNDQTHKTYEQGLIEGRVLGVEETVAHHSTRLDSHEKRIAANERIQYAILGAIALINVLPAIQALVGVNGG